MKNVIQKIWRAFTILMTIAALALVVVGFVLPSKVEVVRETRIEASPETVYDLLNDFDSYARWSLLAQEEGSSFIELSGAFEGVGAMASWNGSMVGPRKGDLEIVEADRPRLVRVDFPLQGAEESYYRWEVAPDGDGAVLTWTFLATFGFDIVARYRGLSLGEWAARDADVAVANIKEIAEDG